MSQKKNRREERERGLQRKGQYVEGFFTVKCQNTKNAQECYIHANSLFYGFSVHSWLGETRAGDS